MARGGQLSCLWPPLWPYCAPTVLGAVLNPKCFFLKATIEALEAHSLMNVVMKYNGSSVPALPSGACLLILFPAGGSVQGGGDGDGLWNQDTWPCHLPCEWPRPRGVTLSLGFLRCRKRQVV